LEFGFVYGIGFNFIGLVIFGAMDDAHSQPYAAKAKKDTEILRQLLFF
jgi:hypothetical protein